MLNRTDSFMYSQETVYALLCIYVTCYLRDYVLTVSLCVLLGRNPGILLACTVPRPERGLQYPEIH